MNWREFRPTIFFLVKFVAIYFVGNFVYGIFVTSYSPSVDPITRLVTDQVAFCLSECGWDVTVVHRDVRPTSSVLFDSKSIISVYEGCNGVNVFVVYLAFIIGFGPYSKEALWFIPLGFAIIHISNILRIGLLFFITLNFPDYTYFFHKYLFTAFIYGVVLLLWIIWVNYIALAMKNEK